jgi:hypothetical protein
MASDVPSRDSAPLARRDLGQARQILNSLLQESSAGRADYLQVGSIGGVDGDRLLDVVATSYSSQGRVLNFLKARQVRVVTDRVNRRIEMVFEDGSIELNGTSRGFPGGSLRKVVAEGDQLSNWASSGLVFASGR